MLRIRQGIGALFRGAHLKCSYCVKTVTASRYYSTANPEDDESKAFKIQINETLSDEEVVTEKYGPITIISLNRPAARNAITKSMATKLTEAILMFENDDSATVGVLHGAGGNFSAGHDMDELREDVNDPSLFLGDDGLAGPTRRIIKKPMICGISGLCMSTGFELALMCDMRIAEATATMGFVSNRRFGIPLMDGGTARLPAIVGMSRALDIILTGRDVTAKEAFDIGLVSRVVASGSVLGQAITTAVSLAKYPQATLNHDRNAVYSTIFGQGFEQLNSSEVMGFSQEVLQDMTRGLDKENDGSNTKFLMSFMPDWEKEEYLRELAYEKMKNAEKSDN